MLILLNEKHLTWNFTWQFYFSLPRLFPQDLCLSRQEKLRTHFMSKISNCEIPPQKSLKKPKKNPDWQAGEMKLLLFSSLLCVCAPRGSAWLWWPLRWQGFLSQQTAHSPPSVQAIKSRCAGRALLWCTPVGWFHSLAAGVGCLPGKLEKKPKRI